MPQLLPRDLDGYADIVKDRSVDVTQLMVASTKFSGETSPVTVITSEPLRTLSYTFARDMVEREKKST